MRRNSEAPATLTARLSDQTAKNMDAATDRASRVPMGRHSRRALDKLLSHTDRAGSAHMPDLISLASRFADERARELCLAL